MVGEHKTPSVSSNEDQSSSHAAPASPVHSKQEAGADAETGAEVEVEAETVPDEEDEHVEAERQSTLSTPKSPSTGQPEGDDKPGSPAEKDGPSKGTSKNPDLNDRIQTLEWQRMVNEAAMKAALIRNKQQKAINKSVAREEARLKARRLEAVIAKEQSKPVLLSDDFLLDVRHKITEDSKRMTEKLRRRKKALSLVEKKLIEKTERVKRYEEYQKKKKALKEAANMTTDQKLLEEFDAAYGDVITPENSNGSIKLSPIKKRGDTPTKSPAKKSLTPNPNTKAGISLPAEIYQSAAGRPQTSPEARSRKPRKGRRAQSRPRSRSPGSPGSRKKDMHWPPMDEFSNRHEDFINSRLIKIEKEHDKLTKLEERVLAVATDPFAAVEDKKKGPKKTRKAAGRSTSPTSQGIKTPLRFTKTKTEGSVKEPTRTIYAVELNPEKVDKSAFDKLDDISRLASPFPAPSSTSPATPISRRPNTRGSARTSPSIWSHQVEELKPWEMDFEQRSELRELRRQEKEERDHYADEVVAMWLQNKKKDTKSEKTKIRTVQQEDRVFADHRRANLEGQAEDIKRIMLEGVSDSFKEWREVISFAREITLDELDSLVRPDPKDLMRDVMNAKQGIASAVDSQASRNRFIAKSLLDFHRLQKRMETAAENGTMFQLELELDEPKVLKMNLEQYVLYQMDLQQKEKVRKEKEERKLRALQRSPSPVNEILGDMAPVSQRPPSHHSERKPEPQEKPKMVKPDSGFLPGTLFPSESIRIRSLAIGETPADDSANSFREAIERANALVKEKE